MFSKAISELKNDKCVDAPWGMNDTGVRSMSFWSLQKTKKCTCCTNMDGHCGTRYIAFLAELFLS